MPESSQAEAGGATAIDKASASRWLANFWDFPGRRGGDLRRAEDLLVQTTLVGNPECLALVGAKRPAVGRVRQRCGHGPPSSLRESWDKQKGKRGYK